MVVGSGIAGLSAVYHLLEYGNLSPNTRVTLLEKYTAAPIQLTKFPLPPPHFFLSSSSLPLPVHVKERTLGRT